MKPFTICQSLVLLLALSASARAETRIETYKTIGNVKLNLTIQLPDGWRADDKRPAIIFLFGGGWNAGSPRQFENHCRYLAARGMVAMCADYRVKSRHNVKAAACVADAKSAMRWVRANAAKLGIDLASGPLPPALDGVEFRAVRRQAVQAEVRRLLLALRLMQRRVVVFALSVITMTGRPVSAFAKRNAYRKFQKATASNRSALFERGPGRPASAPLGSFMVWALGRNHRAMGIVAQGNADLMVGFRCLWATRWVGFSKLGA